MVSAFYPYQPSSFPFGVDMPESRADTRADMKKVM